MAAAKLVKSLLILALFCDEILHINGMEANNEEEDAPDAHIIYDQRQSGKYNIHVVIKDVAIIEMDKNEIAEQNYNDEEYYYDEDDLTVKPLNIKTTTTSVKPLQYATNNKPTIPPVQTTISPAESQNDETTLSPSFAANISKTSYKKLNNNAADFMTSLSTHHRTTAGLKSRSKVEPIYAIEEQPFLQARQYTDDFDYEVPTRTRPKHSKKDDSNIFPNSRIFKVKVHHLRRAPQMTLQRERCHSNQLRDARGNCRIKRSASGSIL